jgi:hypothetical protein
MNTSYKQEPLTVLTTPHHLNLGEMTETLKSNLRLLDGHLPLIWKETLKLNSLYPNSDFNQLAGSLKETNPCNYHNSLVPMIYANRLRRVLAAELMGMNNTNVYDGTITPSGGYIIVKDKGETLVFNDYNWQEGLDLLMENTFITRQT